MKIAFFSFILFPFSDFALSPVKVGDTEITFTPPNDFKPLRNDGGQGLFNNALPMR